MHARPDTAPRVRDHRLILGLELTLSLIGLAVAGEAITRAAEAVHRDGSAAHAVSVLGAELTYPEVNVAAALLLLLAGLGVAVITIGVVDAIRLRQGYCRFAEHVPVVGSLPGRPDVTIIAGDSPQAFCAGYLHPRIYVSAAAVRMLSADELEAVLRHERQHVEARDPLRLACLRVLGRALFFVPALAPLGDRYGELAELRADGAAVRAAGGDRRALASALLTFDSVARPGTGGVSVERVDALWGDQPEWRLPRPLIALSVVALTALIIVVWRASSVASAHATFNLPVVSAQPCMLVFALVPVVAFAGFRTLQRTR